jgi:hypothetical protein
MHTDEKSPIESDQQRLKLSQPFSTQFYLRHPKVIISWIVVLIGCAAFLALRH